jgi:hypothetical protein
MRTKANYKKHPLPSANGNPLVEALHVYDDMNLLLDEIQQTLDVDDFWSMNTIYQQALLQDFARIYVPAPQFAGLYNKFMALLINNYSRSNPFSAKHSATKYELARVKGSATNSGLNTSSSLNRTTAPTLMVHGLSGMGKTTEILAVLSCIPQVIEHHKYNGRYYRQDQLVWLSIDLPATPSIKALALNFFLAVDKALGNTDYYGEWSKKNNSSVDKHLNGVRQVASVHELGLIHIDELQFMLKYAKSKDSPTLQVLEALFNKLGIPLILSCTNQGLELFEMPASRNDVLVDMTTTRRMLNDRDFNFALHRESSLHFNDLFEAFFPTGLQWPGIQLGEDFRRKYFELSCGLPAIMSRLAHLYHETHMQLRERSSKQLPKPVQLLEYVYKHQFKLIDPALRQLRQNNIKQYENLVTQEGQHKAAFSDKEKPAMKQKREKKMPIVKKGGMFDAHKVSTTSLESDIKRGFA